MRRWCSDEKKGQTIFYVLHNVLRKKKTEGSKGLIIVPGTVSSKICFLMCRLQPFYDYGHVVWVGTRVL